jgi:hypothetical protein
MSVISVIFEIHFEKFYISRGTDPLVHHGRHFGRAHHAFCSINTLLNNGIQRMGVRELEGEPEETLTPELFFFSFSRHAMTD